MRPQVRGKGKRKKDNPISLFAWAHPQAKNLYTHSTTKILNKAHYMVMDIHIFFKHTS